MTTEPAPGAESSGAGPTQPSVPPANVPPANVPPPSVPPPEEGATPRIRRARYELLARQERPEMYESWVDRQIRLARERGDFDDLPGQGKPLDLGDPNDEDWWIKAKMEREQLDATAGLPTALGLRKEAATYPEALVDVTREEQVREIVEDYNRRVKLDRLRPAVGNLPPLLARTLDVEEIVAGWRRLRAERQAERAAATTKSDEHPSGKTGSGKSGSSQSESSRSDSVARGGGGGMLRRRWLARWSSRRRPG